MKPTLRPSVFLAAAVLLAACSESRSSLTDPRRDLTPNEVIVGAQSRAFGLELFQQAAASSAKPNVLVSPLSVSMALGMTLNGAAGPTYEAMSTTLGFNEMADSAINDAYRGLIAQLRARDSKVEFGIANSVWYDRTFTVKAPFLDAARNSFAAEVRALDLHAASAPQTISDWVADHTGGRIKDLVKTIDPLDVMLIVNAIYFKAPWTVPFEPNATRPAEFRRADGSTVMANMMTMDHAMSFREDDEVQMVELPYANAAYSMVVFAPTDGRSISSFTSQLTAQKLDLWISGLNQGRVMISMPKFKFEFGTSLNDALENLGMGVAFNPQTADFSRISDHDDLYISKVQHNTFIDVHELGTEASAATSVTMSLTSMPPEVRFDRPFLFAIRERSTGVILFIGRVGDPTATK